MFFKNLSIAKKIFLVIGLSFFILVLIMGYFLNYQFDNLTEDNTNTVSRYLLDSEIDSETMEMADLSQDVNNMINNVAAVSDEAASNAEEVAASSEEQIASTEEIVSAAHRLSEMSDNLKNMISKFKVE
ncbi:MAG: hypothetical protein ACOC4L_01000 [Halanaerobium sp.]